MALEPITRQEQIIAGKNLEPITRMERFLKEYGGRGGGGASHWNELEGKPFVTVGGDTLEWDGNTDGAPYLEEMELYRIADSAPTLNDLNNAGDNISAVIAVSLGEEHKVSRNDIFFEDMGLAGAVQMSIADIAVLLLFPEDADTGEGLVIQKGVYTTVFDPEGDGSYVKSLTVSGYTGFTKEQINPSVLPTKVFYVDATNPVYLYTNKNFTNKATKVEVMSAALNNAIVLAVVNQGAVYATASAALVNFSNYATVYAISYIDNTGTPNYSMLYTAEYTAR